VATAAAMEVAAIVVMVFLCWSTLWFFDFGRGERWKPICWANFKTQEDCEVECSLTLNACWWHHKNWASWNEINFLITAIG
jgi:hypothetical protein